MPWFAHSLCTVGEVGTVKIKTDTTPKLEDWGVHCMFVGYSLMHPTGCYRMYNPKTHRVCVSHNVMWLHRMFYQNDSKEMAMGQITVGNWFKNPQGTSRSIEVGEGISEASDQENYNTVDMPIIENDVEEQSTEDAQEIQEEMTTPSTNYITVSGRASWPPACLIEEMGEAALTTAEQNYYFALSELNDKWEYGSGITNTHELKVMNFHEVMASPDKKEQEASVHESMIKWSKTKFGTLWTSTSFQKALILLIPCG